MNTQRTLNFHDVSWPASQLDEALTLLIQKSGLLSSPSEIQKFPVHLDQIDDTVVGQWMEVVATRLDFDIEAVTAPYPDVFNMIRHAAPAVLKLQDGEQPRFLMILKGGRQRISVITPAAHVQRIPTKHVQETLTRPVEEPLLPPLQELLSEAGISVERQPTVQAAILHEQLGSTQVGGCWILRMSPGTNFLRQIRYAGLPKHLFIILGTIGVEQIFMILGWWIIGRASLTGHFERAWLWAWGLLSLSQIPFELVGEWSQNMLSLRLGGLFKRRLLYGILQLEPEEIRHHGAGQFLGIVMEAEAFESMALGAGFTVLMAVFELFSAVGVLALGAGGWFQALSLLFWMGLTAVICWYYYRYAREWITMYRGMTNDLVERMVGHRTRLAQESREHWHDGEDLILERYLKLSARLDRIGILLQSVIGRGWLILGFSGLIPIFLFSPHDKATLMISLGGIMLAARALDGFSDSILSIMGIIIAWNQVGPLFQAAERQKKRQEFVSMLPAELEVQARRETLPVIKIEALSFRYREELPQILTSCNLQIQRQDRILLEGPSGGGKSTLASLLTGLRIPESGRLLLWGGHQTTIGLNEWRRRVVTAPQFHENFVLTETFAFNLLMGRRWPALEDDLKEAEEICQELGLGDLLERMPAGFQQMVGESGWQLSHGERSRLYIARALLQQADLIILDESFAALDPENLQRALQCVLRRAPTLVVIAHP